MNWERNLAACKVACTRQGIQRLEGEGLIAEADDSAAREDARRGRTYRLSPQGRASLTHHLQRLGRAVDYARAHKLLPSTRS